jgi:hypothetical protein
MTSPSERPVTPADIEAAYEAVARLCIEEFNRDGQLVPCMVGFALDTLPGTLQSTTVALPASAMKSIFSTANYAAPAMELVRQLLEPDSILRRGLPVFGKPLPSIAVLATEGWMVAADDAVSEEVRKLGGVSKHPNRIEVIQIMVHTLTGTAMGTCPIDGITRRASFEPILTDGHWSGRMTMGAETDPDDDLPWRETVKQDGERNV